jgi:hypothetical protein
LLPGADVLAFVDIDSQQKRVYGHAKQGAAFGHTKIQGKSLLVRGLNVLAASICTPLAAPVIAATRLRGGNAASARGAASMITEAVSTARAAGFTGTIVARMDSAFCGAPAVGAARQAGARFSVTVRSGSTDTSRLCQGCFPPSLAPPRSGCPQLQLPAATGRRWRSLTPTRNNSASRRTYSVSYSVLGAVLTLNCQLGN